MWIADLVLIGFLWISLIALTSSLLLIILATLKLRNWKHKLTFVEEQTLLTDPIHVTIIVPAYNEEFTIRNTIQSLLHLQYNFFEIIIINDGSTDGTLGVLKEALKLQESPEISPAILSHKPIRKLFVSELDSRIRVVDKPNGGKHDALNAGISISKYPWFCCVDADTILMPDALLHMLTQVKQFPTAIAVAGHVRVGNSDSISYALSMTQVIEYLRSFIVERIGWSALNSLIFVSGAFSLFDKKAVCRVGGYSSGVPTEDVELIFKLHRDNLSRMHDYKVLYAPKAIAWTEAPKDLNSLTAQRRRWYSGLWVTFYRHRSMLFNTRYRFIGLFTMPYLLLLELLTPLIGSLGVTLTLFISASNSESGRMLLQLLILNFIVECLISTVVVYVDWRMFHSYHSFPNNIGRTLISILIKHSVYSILLIFFKIQAFLAFIQPSGHQNLGKWQTIRRADIRPANRAY